MKILGGRLKGKNIYMPHGIRPTQNLIRKAVFDILGDVTGMKFLELFAGSGAVGLEAFSRGTQQVVLVEKEPFCVEVIEENCKLLGIMPGGGPADPMQCFKGDVFATIKDLACWGRKFDIVFFDPPYGRRLGKKALKTLSAHDIVHSHCFIIAQVKRDETLPKTEGRFFLVRERKYGASSLAIYKVREERVESRE